MDVIDYAGGIDEIRSQVRSHNVQWDLVDLELFDALRAGEEGLLEAVDWDALEPAPDGTPASEDFIGSDLVKYGVVNVLFSLVISYRNEEFERAPADLADFFNLRDYPGGRALRRTPVGNLEWALLADGVRPEAVYKELETDAGVVRALRKLGEIKGVTRWWTDGEQPVGWLERGEVTMASAYNGRAYHGMQRGVDLAILWDRQITFLDVWGVPRHGRNTELAMDFIRFATSPRSLAKQTRYIPYGPVRRSSMAFVPDEVRPFLPTSEDNMATAFPSDPAWWSDNLDRIQNRFEHWLRAPDQVPDRLPR